MYFKNRHMGRLHSVCADGECCAAAQLASREVTWFKQHGLRQLRAVADEEWCRSADGVVVRTTTHNSCGCSADCEWFAECGLTGRAGTCCAQRCCGLHAEH